MSIIEIYTTQYCPYCTRAKMLFKQKNIPFKELAIDTNRGLRKIMQDRSGGHTVPQIFIDDQHIGGCDDLFSLERKGQLDPLLST
ncbi:MAG: glutaredoxin 3 [Oceanospirillaceae bacterium]|nr:glutaredoxin 3 [Oceanospirillaceae bacterium]